ncbi:hypothetical protein ACQV5M_21885, partial [Leptospira sp. SA-E8]
AAFEMLEVALAEPSDMLEAYGESVRRQGDEVADEVRVWVLLAMALAASVVLVLCGRIISNVLRGLLTAGRVAEAVAQGDLTRTVDASEGYTEVRQLLTNLGQMNDNLRRLVQGVQQAAESVAAAGGQIASGNNDLSARTETQASALQ